MRIKNLRGVSEVRFKKKLDSFTLETSKNHLIRNFLRNGRVRVKKFLIRKLKKGINFQVNVGDSPMVSMIVLKTINAKIVGNQWVFSKLTISVSIFNELSFPTA